MQRSTILPKFASQFRATISFVPFRQTTLVTADQSIGNRNYREKSESIGSTLIKNRRFATIMRGGECGTNNLYSNAVNSINN